MPENRLDVCLVAHLAFGAIAGRDQGHIGGVEKQTTLMARWLAERGHRVSLITWDEGQGEGVVFDGVRVFKTCRRDAGLPGLRFLHPRWTSLNAALARADARLYYHNCAEYVTGQVALWAGLKRRRFIFSVAGDRDVLPDLPELKTIRERVLYRYGLRRADRLLVQTRFQKKTLAAAFGHDAIVVPMPCPGPTSEEFVSRDPPGTEAPVLWLGRISEEKRPDRFLDLAQVCPDLRFDLVGPAAENPYALAVVERARGLANVTYHGPALRDRVAALYRRAGCLCNTSDHEGFPNTFLEAWSHGLPVVSQVDPDGLIAERGLGIVGADVPALADALRALLGSPERWKEASRQARRYYAENHLLEPAMTRFERIFLEVSAT